MRFDFSTISPEQRRLILVASDEKYQELISAFDFRKIGKEVLYGFVPFATYLRIFFGAATAASDYLSTLTKEDKTDQETKSDAAKGGLRKHFKERGLLSESKRLLQIVGGRTKRAYTKGEIPIPHIPQDEAAQLFRFDVGHPIDGCAYLLNPCLEDHYLPPALANERLTQEKLAAFIDINASLGAKKLEILSAAFKVKTKKKKTGLLEAAAQVGLSSYVGKDGSVSKQIYMEFDEPGTSPSVPDCHKNWLNTDPLLRSLITARLDHRVRSAQIALHFSETIDVRAEVCAEIAKRGINVGGEYHEVHSSTWNFMVQFWPYEV
jgi:hypothetical protein